MLFLCLKYICWEFISIQECSLPYEQLIINFNQNFKRFYVKLFQTCFLLLKKHFTFFHAHEVALSPV